MIVVSEKGGVLEGFFDTADPIWLPWWKFYNQSCLNELASWWDSAWKCLSSCLLTKMIGLQQLKGGGVVFKPQNYYD